LEKLISGILIVRYKDFVLLVRRVLLVLLNNRIQGGWR